MRANAPPSCWEATYLPGYATIDALVAYETGPRRFSLNMTNLAEARYYDSASSDAVIYPGMPRSWRVELSIISRRNWRPATSADDRFDYPVVVQATAFTESAAGRLVLRSVVVAHCRSRPLTPTSEQTMPLKKVGVDGQHRSRLEQYPPSSSRSPCTPFRHSLDSGVQRQLAFAACGKTTKLMLAGSRLTVFVLSRRGVIAGKASPAPSFKDWPFSSTVLPCSSGAVKL